jgi:hypothetical protein
MKELKSKIEYVLEDYASFVTENGRIPSGIELKDQFALTKKTVEHHFGNYERLMRAALLEYPKAFKNVFMPEDFSKSAFETLKLDCVGYKRFVITTAIVGQRVFEPGLNALLNYCEKKKAKLLIMPLGKELLGLDSRLKPFGIVTGELYLNSNIKLVPVRLSEKTLNPTAGLARVGARSCTTIYPAPKLTKLSIPTDMGRFPRLMLSTGAITQASYGEKHDLKMVKKADYIAEADHELSAVIVEISDDHFFFQREMQIDIDGSVVDVGPKGAFRYHASGKVTKEKAKAMSVGDWHSGLTSQAAFDLFPAIAAATGAERVLLHDVFNMSSHSHHTVNDAIVSAQLEERGDDDLVSELEGLADDFSHWLKKTQASIEIVASNHPEHLNKAISMGFLNRPSSFRIYCQLALAMLDGHDPLQFGLKEFAGFEHKRIRFLSRDDKSVIKTKVKGPNGKLHSVTLQLNYHGDKGANGARGPQSLAVALGCSIVGHTHTPRIDAGNNGLGMWTNGTATCINGKDVPHYAQGSASSWLQTSTLVFMQPGGKPLRTQITLIGGQWCLESGKPKTLEVLPDQIAKVHKIRAHKNALKKLRGLKK